MAASKVAKYWESAGDKVVCKLCPHNCSIKDGGIGLCRARKNIDGILYTLNYGLISSCALDPIEKKPLHHFYPGTNIFSVGTFGCNLKCSFCQNYTIAHENPETVEATSEQLIAKAKEAPNCIGIAFTYNEPAIWYEFVYDTCVKAKKEGLKNVLVTNGYISEEPLNDILPYIDAMNIDVKGYSNKYYKDVCFGSLEHVKRTVEIAAKRCHVEVTTLVVPGLNDSLEQIREECLWLSSIDKNIPLHLSRYFPNYKMDIAPTPKEILYNLHQESKKYLNKVYLGNIF